MNTESFKNVTRKTTILVMTIIANSSFGIIVSGTSDYVYANGSVISGPELPYTNQYHSMVKLHDGSVMIIGGLGNNKQNEKRSTIFNPLTGSFSSGPDLIYGRIHTGVAVINR